MRTYTLFIFFCLFVLSSCKKSESDGPGSGEPKFEVTKLTSQKERYIVGQVIDVKADMPDKSGNILYEWVLRKGDITLSDQRGSQDNFEFHVTDEGEYEVELTVMRGSNDRFVYREKMTIEYGDFQFGIWGDNQETILQSEEANGYTRFGALVGVPEVIEGNEGLTHITFERGLTRFTYFFKNNKLMAGGSIFIYNNFNDGRPAYSDYGMNKLGIESGLGIELPNEYNWTIGDESQKAHYLTDGKTISDAIRFGYLSIRCEGRSERGFGKAKVYRASYGLVSEYSIASKDLHQ